MLRLVAMPDTFSAGLRWGIDRRGDLPGHSCWLYPERSLIMGADTQTLLGCTPQVLQAYLLAQVKQQVVELLHGLQRSGEYQIGGDRIVVWWRKNRHIADIIRECLLLAAHDGGSVKLWRYLDSQGRKPDFRLHSQQQLGEVFGRSKLGAVLVINSGFCLKIRRELYFWHQLDMVRAEASPLAR
jgi:predicted RNA-binding protein YlxR (DUF448 family)